MKTKKPYIQTAYCPVPGCWTTFTIISQTGIDEQEPLLCPSCGNKEARLSDYRDCAGDKLREIEADEKQREIDAENRRREAEEKKRKKDHDEGSEC